MANLMNQPPDFHIADSKGNAAPGWQAAFSTIIRIIQALTLSGTTTNRPTAFLWVGRPYLDTTLAKPIWLKSYANGIATWIDATGTPV